jgi:hypothetical protein
MSHAGEYQTWGLLAAGAVFLLGALLSMLSGSVWQSVRHRWGFLQHYQIRRDDNPIQFWFMILIQVLIGAALLGFGLERLIESPR